MRMCACVRDSNHISRYHKYLICYTKHNIIAFKPVLAANFSYRRGSHYIIIRVALKKFNIFL